jgi:IstB-like ATP binding protein
MVAAALIDRLVHHADIITLKGKSYRLRDRGNQSRAAAVISARRPTADDLNHSRRTPQPVHYSLPENGALFGSC